MSNRIKSIESLNRSLERKYSNPSLRGSLFNSRVEKNDRNLTGNTQNPEQKNKRVTVIKSDRRGITIRESRLTEPIQPIKPISIQATPTMKAGTPETSYIQTRQQLDRNWNKPPKLLLERPKLPSTPPELSESKGCPLWLLVLLTAISLIGIVTCVWLVRGMGSKQEGGCLGNNKQLCQRDQANIAVKGQKNELKEDANQIEGRCSEGFFLVEGRCLACPQMSYWNGTHCIRRRIIEQNPSEGHSHQKLLVGNLDYDK